MALVQKFRATPNLGVDLYFDSDDNSLWNISIYSNNYVLNGIRSVGLYEAK